MQRKLASVVAIIAVTVGISVLIPQDSSAQGQTVPAVTMVTLQTTPGQNGQQMVITPRGKIVPLPGAGVNGNVVQVYMGSQGGVWYVDKNGQQEDLTAAYAAFQRSNQTASQVPQYAPQPVVNNNYYSQGSSGSSSGSSTGSTMLAAGVGAATGAALTNALMEPTYYAGVPYGYPVAYGANNRPYYVNREGNNVYVNNDVNKTANFNQANVNSYHANNFQEQQNWYNKQVTNNTATFKNWQNQQENPFVHPDASGWNRNASGDANRFANSGKEGRFGNRGGDGGGLFKRGGDGGGGLLGGGEGRRGGRGGRFR